MAGLRSTDVINAAIDALGADATLIALVGTAKVFTHVPAETPMPYVIVLPGREAPTLESFDNDSARTVDVLVTCLSNYAGSKQLSDIVDRVAEVLTTTATWTGVSGITAWRFSEATPTGAMDGQDGRIVYERTVTVQVWVQ